MTVYAYLRYSSANQIGGVSLDLQRDAISSFLEQQPELKNHHVVESVDEAKTGTTLVGRTGLQSILRSAQPGDSLVIYKYDRLGRNLLESLQTLQKLEQDLGVTVLSCTEPNSEVLRNLLLTMAQEYSKQLGDRCKRALSAIAASGHAANKAAFGYGIVRPAPNTRGKFVPVPDKAAIVKSIFEMRADGMSHRRIAQELNEKQIPSPAGRFWCSPTINDILINEVYIGRTISGIRIFKKGYRGPGSGKKRPRSEWAICENAHEAIISRELWDRVHSLRDASEPKNRACRRIHRNYLWTGFLRCAACGANLVRQNSRGIVYYGCDSQRNRGNRLPCHSRCLIRELDLTATILLTLSNQVCEPGWLASTIHRIRHEVERRSSFESADLRNATEQFARLRSQIEQAERRLVYVPEDSLPSFLSELNKLKVNRDAAISELKKLEGEPGLSIDVTGMDKQIRIKLKTFWQNLASENLLLMRRELARHIEKIEVASDLTTKVYVSSDGLLAKVEKLDMGWDSRRSSDDERKMRVACT